MPETTADSETRYARRRRRGAALEQAILQAAIEELLAVGYHDLTMDRVARRAGTNKNAIYRRWPNRAALAVAAYGQMAESEAPVADTGTLRTDVLATLRRINSDAASPAGVIRRSLVSSIGEDSELRARLLERVVDDTAASWLQIVCRAVARGEASPDALHPRVATVALVLLRNEYLTRGIDAILPDSAVVEIVDEVYLPLIRGRSSQAWATSTANGVSARQAPDT